MKKKLYALTLTMLAAPAVCGAIDCDYYISPTGSDAYSAVQAANPSTPWALPSAAAAKIYTAGVTPATVCIAAGAYTDAYTRCRLGGITWTAYNGVPVISHTGTDNIFWLLEGDDQVIDGLTLQRNTATTGSIITVQGARGIIKNSVLNSFGGATGGDCIKGNAPDTGVGGQATGCIVRDNYFSGCPDQGIDLVHNNGWQIHDNHLTGCSDCIVVKGGSEDAVVYQNTCLDPVYAGVLIGGDTGAIYDEHAYEAKNVIAHHNLTIYSTNENNGIRFQGATNSAALNNTTVGGSLRVMSSVTVVKNSANNLIKNNIFYGAGNDGVAKVDINNTTGNTFASNLYYCGAGCTFTFGWGADYINFATWLTSSGSTDEVYENPYLSVTGKPTANSPQVVKRGGVLLDDYASIAGKWNYIGARPWLEGNPGIPGKPMTKISGGPGLLGGGTIYHAPAEEYLGNYFLDGTTVFLDGSTYFVDGGL